MKRTCVLIVALLAVHLCNVARLAEATGVLYADPGWTHAFDGQSAYYHDPDGPNPDYVSAPPVGNDSNKPGGQSDSPALINPGPCTTNCNDIAIWQISGSNWDGTAPGAPLGGVPTGTPPIPPAAPGGVGAFTSGSTNYIRIQDPGNPQSYGWTDKNAQFATGYPLQEGNNRRIQFKHQMSRDAGFTPDPAIMDSGVTVAFRARIATAATGPIDAAYPEGGTTTANVLPWPTDGLGYPIGNNGRGLFMITQSGEVGPSQLSFSLLDTNAITTNNLTTVTRTGLVMNNRASGPGGGSPDTGDSTAATLNMVDIPNSQLQDWHEFWITVKKLPAVVDNNTHEVKVYLDGSLTPTTFQVILGLQNEFGSGSNLGIGLSSGTRAGAFDIDYYAYKQGTFTPTLAPTGVAGDYNANGVVDAADYVLWRNGGPLQNDSTPGVQPADYDVWRANFAKTPGSGSSLGAVPEPNALLLSVAALSLLFSLRFRKAA